MSLSGTRNFIQTRNLIIESALRKIGVSIQGGIPSSIQYTEASNALNSMVQSWQNRGIFLWTIQQNILNLVSGTGMYVISGSSILDVQNPMLRNNNVDSVLDEITREEYVSLSSKALTGTPSKIYIFMKLNEINIFLNPIPNTSSSHLILDCVLQAQDFNTEGNNPDFPVGWSDALIWGLAFRISHEYGIPIQEREALRREAEQFFMEALANSREGGSIQFGRKV